MKQGTLYLVGTPIGNLGDFSPRAAQTLEAADFIAAEDTRVSIKLLNHFGIQKPLISYHEHNRHQRGDAIVARLLDGESCALLTDAGMPCISDPGEELVRACDERGVEVVSVPGPSAVITAVSLSGLPGARFCFEGFLPVKKGPRQRQLDELKRERRTILFYEAPHKLLGTLRDLLDALGDRRVSLCREMTKLHEEVWRTTLGEAAAHYAEHAPRGEFVLVVAGSDEPLPEEQQLPLDEALALLRELREGGLSLAQASREAAKRSGRKKAELYRAALADGGAEADEE